MARYTHGSWPGRDAGGSFLKLKPNRSAVYSFVLAIALLWGASEQCRAASQGIPQPVIQAHRGKPVDVSGREVIYNSKTDTFIVRGNAVMTQGGTVLKADEIWVMRRDHKARAVGHVHLTDPETKVTAKVATLDLNNETVELTDGEVYAHNNSYRLAGAKLRKLVGQRYQIDKGFFTTCGCEKGTPDWSISGDQIDLHMGSSGSAKEASFNILGVPILKVPRAIFPADSTRHSGFLSPRAGESGLRGFQLLQPYFIDINKSSDATVALDVETSQRVGLMTEYRLTNGPDDYFWADGGFYNEDLRTTSNRQSDIVDNQVASPFIPVNRYDFVAMTRQHLTSNLMVYGDALSVSDPFLLRELNLLTLSRGFGNSFTSMRNAMSDFGAIDSFQNGYAQLSGVINQDLIQPQRYALQTLPSLLITGIKPLFNGLAYAEYDVQAVNYWRQTGLSGQRLDIDPHLTVPWQLGNYLWGDGTVGFDETIYESSGDNIKVTPVGTQGLQYNNALSLGGHGPGGFSHRELPYAQFNAATKIDKIYDLNWESISKVKHTIEPFVSYAYVPNINQDNLPLFDQVDRYNARSLLTYGITSRLIAKIPGAASIPNAQSEQPVAPFSLSDSIFGARAADSVHGGDRIEEVARFTVQQAYDTNHAVDPISGSGMSDVEANLSLLPTKIASLGTTVDYDPRTRQQINFASVYFDFQPPWTKNTPNLYMGRAMAGSFLQLSYNYIGPHATVITPTEPNGSELLMLRSYYDLFDRLGVYFAPSYDMSASRLLSAEYGIRIKSPCDCWSIDFGIVDTVNPNELAYQFQVTLGGLGSVGQMPFGRNPFQVMGINRQPGFFPGY
ncbi:MAG TPA: LPS assembly protein LptD [Candidatus Binataceae bacterium]|nr:LPS assembly protein LptD [Candidatus Binataceae bacterium]